MLYAGLPIGVTQWNRFFSRLFALLGALLATSALAGWLGVLGASLLRGGAVLSEFNLKIGATVASSIGTGLLIVAITVGHIGWWKARQQVRT